MHVRACVHVRVRSCVGVPSRASVRMRVHPHVSVCLNTDTNDE